MKRDRPEIPPSAASHFTLTESAAFRVEATRINNLKIITPSPLYGWTWTFTTSREGEEREREREREEGG